MRGSAFMSQQTAGIMPDDILKVDQVELVELVGNAPESGMAWG